jgi:hypothetical protein
MFIDAATAAEQRDESRRSIDRVIDPGHGCDCFL